MTTLTEEEYVKHFDEDDFTEVYGSPVIIQTQAGKKYLSYDIEGIELSDDHLLKSHHF